MGSKQEKVWKCSTCSKTFPTKQRLTNHIVTHDPEAKVKCQICGKFFKNPQTLSSHMSRLHSNRKRPSCTLCHRVFCSPSYLWKHIDAVHRRTERPRFTCEFPGCGKTYLNKEDASQHIKSEHTENPTRFPCTLCGREFKIRRYLQAHISTHTTEKAHICSTCGRRFAQRSAMNAHEVTHLEKSLRKILKCELCPRTFFSGADLRRHVQFVHENRRNHPCTFCHQRFSTSSDMRRHVAARHPANSEKIHSCDKCEFMTHMKQYLVQHARRHNPAHRRECYFCRKEFFHSSALVQHFRHHTLEK
ncbi:Zinc finger protein 26 [Folsomia candida]|uniref:Zinc finger protein 26 n=2 Tax=Folsomia candida TaxID=158441 RepID=A0A226DRW5_FOLCA|nr:Zinc finger protein 26 [Folsomia candida]